MSYNIIMDNNEEIVSGYNAIIEKLEKRKAELVEFISENKSKSEYRYRQLVYLSEKSVVITDIILDFYYKSRHKYQQ